MENVNYWMPLPEPKAMKQIETQKGKFIVVPTPDNAIIEMYRVNLESVMVRHTDPLFPLRVNDLTKIGHYRGPIEQLPFEIIGLVSEILKDEEKAKMVVDVDDIPISHRLLFQNLVEDYELKETDLLIKKI